jgi:hypothetical protein
MGETNPRPPPPPFASAFAASASASAVLLLGALDLFPQERIPRADRRAILILSRDVLREQPLADERILREPDPPGAFETLLRLRHDRRRLHQQRVRLLPRLARRDAVRLDSGARLLQRLALRGPRGFRLPDVRERGGFRALSLRVVPYKAMAGWS